MLGRYKGEDVAVKLLPLVGSDEERRRLVNELLMLARVTGKCAHACRLYGTCTVGEDQAREQAIVMQLYRGNLRQYIAAQPGGKVPMRRAVMLAQDLLRGLAELHGIGIVMADLKPDNVLMSDVGVPLLCDFGISRAVTNTIGRYTITQATGTPNYMAPEQFATEDSNHVYPASDMWTFAATLVHMLSGTPPWGGQPPHVIIMKVGMQKQAPELPPGLSPFLEALLADCFKTRPEDRPTAVEALARVEAMIEIGEHPNSGGAHPAVPPAAPSPPAPVGGGVGAPSSAPHSGDAPAGRSPSPVGPPTPPPSQPPPGPPARVLSYVTLVPSYKDYGDAKDGPLRPGKYGIVLGDDESDDELLVKVLATGHVADDRWVYKRKALQAVPKAAVPGALRLRPWHPAGGKRGVPVCPGNARLGMLVQRGYHWRNASDTNGLNGEIGVLIDCDEDCTVLEVEWAGGCKGTYHAGKDGQFELAHVQLHEHGGAPVYDGDGSRPGAAVMRGYGWHWGSQDGAPSTIGSLQPCGAYGWVTVLWPGNKFNDYRADLTEARYDLCHAVRPGEPVTVFTAREGLAVVRGPVWSDGDVDGGNGLGSLIGPVRVTEDGTGIVWSVRWANSGIVHEHLVMADGSHCELQHAPYNASSVQLGTTVRLAPGGRDVGDARSGPLKEDRMFRGPSVGVVVGVDQQRSRVQVMALRNRRTWWYERRALELMPGDWANESTPRVVLNRDGRAAFPGEKDGFGGDTGRDSDEVFYCGARMNQCRCGSCDGVCGPDNGCPCHACLELLGLRVGPRAEAGTNNGGGGGDGRCCTLVRADVDDEALLGALAAAMVFAAATN